MMRAATKGKKNPRMPEREGVGEQGRLTCEATHSWVKQFQAQLCHLPTMGSWTCYLMMRLNEIKHIKYLEQCLVQSKKLKKWY